MEAERDRPTSSLLLIGKWNEYLKSLFFGGDHQDKWRDN